MSSSSYSDSSKSSKSFEKELNSKDLYHKLKRKQKYIERKYKVTYLKNSDFKHGSYIIDKPGIYVLKEDIVFNPNPNDDHMPRKDQKQYQTRAFSLGFFAAIIIQSKNVHLDLNNHRIDQSKEHALQQRFFSIIELASSPFIPNQGPGNFGPTIKTSKNVIIRNGTIGRSSHHGVHGNLTKWLLFEDLVLEDFEVAGIAVNGSDSVVFNHVKIRNSRNDVPVLATYSAARFARFFALELLNSDSYQLTQDQKDTLKQKLDPLENDLNKAYDQIIETGKTSVTQFKNDTQLPDGNIYGLLLHTPGVAVDDFIVENHKEKMDWTKNVSLRYVKVKNIRCKVNEIVSISRKDGKGIQNDVSGAAFQIDNLTNESGIYQGTSLSELQLFLAELAIKLGISLGKNNITQDTIDWAKSGKPVSELLSKGYKYKCNTDSMFHVNKGAIGYRFDGVDNLTMVKCKLDKLVNFGRLGNEDLDGAYVISHDKQKRPGYGGCESIGINLSYCRQIMLDNNSIHGVLSSNGDVIGINIINKSRSINIYDIGIKGLYGGTLSNGKWEGEDYYGNTVPYVAGLPNNVPNTVGIYISKDSKRVNIGKRCIKDLVSPGCEVPIWSN